MHSQFTLLAIRLLAAEHWRAQHRRQNYYRENRERMLVSAKIASKHRYAEKRDLILKQQKTRYQTDPNLRSIRNERARAWDKNNPEAHRARLRKDYQKHNRTRRFAAAISTGVRIALRTLKDRPSIRYVGCTLDELKQHLESKFLTGMSWENFGRGGWHIDHRIPLAKFNLSDPEQLKRAWHFTNLQPLWERDNIRKRDRVSADWNNMQEQLAL